MSNPNKFGIGVRLPENDPMAAEHLLGSQWQGTRWFESAEERDSALLEMQNHPRYYRRGDAPSIVLEKLDSQKAFE